jgi:KDO2-lipid IV(A) lauroyltransferase
VALMIDQRVSEGESVEFFNRLAKTTTIPAQLVKKYNCRVVPIYIERKNKHNFKISIQDPLQFNDEYSIKEISEKLNKVLEKMILKNPEQWIWTHDRWK